MIGLSALKAKVSGGIWYLWWTLNVSVKLLVKNDQLITLAFMHSTNVGWVFLSLIYASPILKCRMGLSEYTKQIGNCLSCPWLLLGEFNKCYHTDGGIMWELFRI